jgi:CHAD domain-containing protein
MKGKELEKVTAKYVRSLEKNCRNIPGSFTVEAIHDLRVDYKRLRAFIRLCREEPHTKGLDIPDSLHDVYGAAGDVRDRQLFLAKIMLFAKVQYALPAFTKCLQQQLFKAKEHLVKKIEKIDWEKLNKSFKEELPDMLHDAAIRRFVNRKVAAIHILMLAAEREEDLHEVRKNLKDLVHVSRIFENDWGIAFPFPAWKDEKDVNEMAEKLGDFNDECITLAFLDDDCGKNIPAEESNKINIWRNMQRQQVETDKRKLLQEIQQLHLAATAAPVK